MKLPVRKGGKRNVYCRLLTHMHTHVSHIPNKINILSDIKDVKLDVVFVAVSSSEGSRQQIIFGDESNIILRDTRTLTLTCT